MRIRHCIDLGGWRVRSFLGVLALTFGVPAPAQNSNTPDNQQVSTRVVVVSISDRRLVLVENQEVVATFAVAVGAAESPSPTGEFTIVNRVTNPTYYHSGSVIPSGKDNPVGTRWIGLNLKGYGIHGTNAPRSIGRAASHGCIRLRNRDMERLFSMIRTGDRVEIHGERDEQISRYFASDGPETLAAAQSSAQIGGQ